MKTANDWLEQFDENLENMTVKSLIEAVQKDALNHAADIVRERAVLLERNNCKDTIREHYAEQQIRSAAMPNVDPSEVADGRRSD